MRLSELLRGPREGQGVTTGGTATGGVTSGSESEIEIRGLSADSRKIEPGFLFAALPGSKPGTYLLEERALAVVPVPRLLPELLAPVAEVWCDAATCGIR